MNNTMELCNTYDIVYTHCDVTLVLLCLETGGIYSGYCLGSGHDLNYNYQ